MQCRWKCDVSSSFFVSADLDLCYREKKVLTTEWTFSPDPNPCATSCMIMTTIKASIINICWFALLMTIILLVIKIIINAIIIIIDSVICSMKKDIYSRVLRNLMLQCSHVVTVNTMYLTHTPMSLACLQELLWSLFLSCSCWRVSHCCTWSLPLANASGRAV